MRVVLPSHHIIAGGKRIFELPNTDEVICCNHSTKIKLKKCKFWKFSFKKNLGCLELLCGGSNRSAQEANLLKGYFSSKLTFHKNELFILFLLKGDLSKLKTDYRHKINVSTRKIKHKKLLQR